MFDGRVSNDYYRQNNSNRGTGRFSSVPESLRGANVTCHQCHRIGHLARNCKSRKICYSCGGLGHFSYECPSGGVSIPRSSRSHSMDISNGERKETNYNRYSQRGFSDNNYKRQSFNKSGGPSVNHAERPVNYQDSKLHQVEVDVHRQDHHLN